ncbi:MAG TPA: electron transport complex subunit RsxG [Rhodocyclaceae bacterium]
MSRRLEVIRLSLAYQPVLLAVVVVLAGAALVLANRVTHEPIARAEADDRRQMLSQVVPAELPDNDLLADVVTVDGPRGKPLRVHLARRDGRVVAAAFETVGRGYAGDIVLLMAVDADGRVLGVRVLRHQETPGLGDKIEIAKNPWIDGFAGRTLASGGWAVKKDGGEFDAFAGATITPRAVVKAVHEGLQFFQSRRNTILGAKP